MPGILVATGFVRIDSDTKPALKAIQSLGAIGASALSTTMLPATAAVSAGLATVAASAAVAGGAMAVYGAAVKPQFADITKAMQQQSVAEDSRTKAAVNASLAQDLAAKSGFKYGQQVEITKDMTEEAKQRAQEYNTALSASKSSSNTATKAQALYKEQLNGMPPATRKTAESLAKLKEANTEWSRSLSSSTMPVFTKALDFLRGLLPKLTPIVKSVAKEIDGFVSHLGEGSAGKIFKEFGKNVTTSGAGALRTFLEIAKNMTAGILGILNAFMPMSAGVTGGLQEMTEKFATWSAGLGKSAGFATFIQTAKDAAPLLRDAFKAIASAFMDIAEAAGPLSGIGLQVLKVFAQLVDAIPTPVLQVLVPTIIAVNLAMKAWAIYQSIAAAATWLFAESVIASNGAVASSRFALILFRIQAIAYAVATGIMTVATSIATAATWALGAAIAFVTSPIGIVVIAIGLLVTAFVILWKKSDGFRNFWKTLWKGIQDVAVAVGKWFSGPFVRFFTEMIPNAFQAVIDWVKQYWPWLIGALGGPIGLAVVAIVKNWDKIKEGASNMLSAVVNFFKELPGRVTSAVGGLGKLLYEKGRDLLKGLLSGAQTIINTYQTWAADMRRKVVNAIGNLGRLIYEKGRDLIRGLLAGAAFVVNTFGVWAAGIRRRVTTSIGNLGRLIYEKGRDLIRGLLSGAANIVSGFGTWAKGIRDKIREKIGSLKETLSSRGRDLISGLINGAKDRLKDIGDWATGVKDKIVGAIKSVFGIKSPSRVMMGLGVHMMAGLLKGLLRSGGVLKGAVKGLFKSPISAAKSLVENGVDVLGFLGKNASKYAQEFFGAIGLGSSGGADRFKTQVAMALRMLGQPIGLTGITLRRMNQESGGNPTAVNKWDSNWQAGHPSVGLMQVIRGTFQAYAGQYKNKGPFMYGVSVDPLANIFASMRYALSRYGSLASAYNRPGGYALGTAGAAPGWHWVGEYGPELMRTRTGDQIRSHRQSQRMTAGGGLHIDKLVLQNQGVIGSRQEVEDWLVRSLDSIGQKKRVPKSFGGS